MSVTDRNPLDAQPTVPVAAAAAGGGRQTGGREDGGYEVVWPRSRQAILPQDLAKRPDSLEGATVAFLWDYLFRGDEIFPIIAEELTARFPGITIVDWPEFGSTHGEDEHAVIAALPAMLRDRGVDVVVSGMAC